MQDPRAAKLRANLDHIRVYFWCGSAAGREPWQRQHNGEIEDAITLEEISKTGWNDMHVIANGNNFKFLINGKLASEFTENIPPEKRLDKGMITLQIHDPGMIVYFKNIRLKLLPE
jgi:hypothetical protein